MKTVRSIARKIFCLIIVAILIFAGYNIYLRVTHKTDFSDLVKRYSNEYGVDEHLILAVIKCESSFDKEAVSSAGARGLMQLTEETFYDVRKMVGNGEEYTFETHWNDADTNIKYGTRYIAYLLELFDGDKVAALASYNAGMGHVNKWLGENRSLELSEIQFPETRDYVERVLEAEKIYNKLYS